MSTEPRDPRVAHAQVRARRLDILGSPDRPPVFHVFQEFYARSLHEVKHRAGGVLKHGGRPLHEARGRRRKGEEG